MSQPIARGIKDTINDFNLKLPNERSQATLSTIRDAQTILSRIIETVQRQKQIDPSFTTHDAWISKQAVPRLQKVFQNRVREIEQELMKDDKAYLAALDNVRGEMTVKKEKVMFTPEELGIQISEEKDLAIFRKIIRSIVTLPCGFAEFSDYAGGDAYESFFQTHVANRFDYKTFEMNHDKDVIALILYGPPGTGKTFMAEALAGYMNIQRAAKNKRPVTLMVVSSGTIKGPYVGESEKAMQYLFQTARGIIKLTNSPVVLFFDEIDGLIETSKDGGSAASGLLSEFNTQTQGVGVDNTNLISIAATNYPDKIPMAAFDRFRYKLYIGHPDVSTIREILLNKMRSFGKTQLNLVNPLFPKWMQRIDWNREKFILDYLGTDKISGKEFDRDGEVSLKFPSEFGNIRPIPDNDPGSRIERENQRVFSRMKQSVFFGSIEDGWDESKENNFGYPKLEEYRGWQNTNKSGIDEMLYENLYPKGEDKIPWDFLDFFSYILHKKHYTPRVLDTIWFNILARAEQRSVVFSTSAVSNRDLIYQKWILEQTTIKRKTVKDDVCDIGKMTVYRMIPLYTFNKDEKQSEKNQLENELRKNTVEVIYGNLVEHNVVTYTDGRVNTSTGTKLYPPHYQGDNYARVITTKTTKKAEGGIDIKIIEASDPKSNFNSDETNIANIPYEIVSTSKENFAQIAKETKPLSEKEFNVQVFSNVLASSQITIDDCLKSLENIKPGTLQNIEEFLKYAKLSSVIDEHNIVQDSIKHLETLAIQSGINIRKPRMGGM